MASAGGRTAPLINPSTGDAFATAPVSSPDDVERALRSAKDAFGSWRRTTPSERSLALIRIADAVEARAEELVRTECENTGKPFGLTMSEEIPPMVDQIRFFASAARLLEGRAATEYIAGHTSYVRREPVRPRSCYAMELPDDDGCLEVGAGDSRWQHDGDKAV